MPYSSTEDYMEEKRFTLPYTPDFELIETEERAYEVVVELKDVKILAVDTETTGLDPYNSKLLLIQIAVNNKCYILNCAKVNPSVWNDLLSNPNILKILQNAVFDYKFLKVHADVSTRPVFDTMIAERLITVGKQNKTSLKFMASKYLGLDLDKEIRKDFVGVYRDKFSRSELMYAANDALILPEIYDRQVDALQRDGLVSVALLEFKTVIPIAEMELSGCLIDTKKWKILLEVARKNRDDLEKVIQEKLLPVCDQLTIFGESTINISSQKQLLHHLHKLGIDIPDTSEETLRKYKHSVTDLLVKWRGWQTVLARYGKKFLARIDSRNGRLYANFNQVRADTGRTSSSNPNLQQIPGFDPEDPDSLNFRSCFVAPKGYKIVGSDYSQQELRILAEISGDPKFLEAFINNEDVHEKTACFVYNKKPEEVTKTERKKTKVTNFTVSYGGSAYTIANRLGISEQEAEEIVDAYFKAYPKVKEYIFNAGHFAVENGYSMSVSGRRRYYNIPTLDDPDYKKKIRSIRRKAANMPIQAAAADVSKQALCNLFYTLEKTDYDVKLLMFVHDELIMEVKEEHAEKVAKILEQSMINGFSDFFKKVPMKVDCSISDCWDH